MTGCGNKGEVVEIKKKFWKEKRSGGHNGEVVEIKKNGGHKAEIVKINEKWWT